VLERYTESRYEPDPDFVQYRRELALWLHDYRRDQERARSERTPLLGHDAWEARNGYDPQSFDIMDIRTKIAQRPALH
jgi:hypothetical protein